MCCQLDRRPASFNTGEPRRLQITVVRRISSGSDESSPLPVLLLRPSHSEPHIPTTNPSSAHPGSTHRGSAHHSSTRRRVTRDPSANPSPPLGRHSSSSSSPLAADCGPSPAERSSVVRGPPRQRQSPPPMALPPAGRRPPAGSQSSRTAATGRAGKTDRQRKGVSLELLL